MSSKVRCWRAHIRKALHPAVAFHYRYSLCLGQYTCPTQYKLQWYLTFFDYSRKKLYVKRYFMLTKNGIFGILKLFDSKRRNEHGIRSRQQRNPDETVCEAISRNFRLGLGPHLLRAKQIGIARDFTRRRIVPKPLHIYHTVIILHQRGCGRNATPFLAF